MAKRQTDDAMELALLKEQLKNMNDQLNRLVSHFESEQRVSVNQGKRIDQLTSSVDMQTTLIQKTIENQQKIIDKHEGILLNGGRGVTYRIDRLEERIRNFKDVKATVIAVISVIIALLGLFIKVIEK